LEGEDKTTHIFEALSRYVELRQYQGDYLGAVTFAEEAYNLVVDTYNPVHPQVQEAAGLLIDCMIKKRDLSNAERFAEQTYANLRDIKNGTDQEGEIMARGAYNFADIISRQDDGDLIKAEGLAREALRIRDKLHGAHDSRGDVTYLLLAKILQKQGKLGGETNELFERSLAICGRDEGPDGVNTAGVHVDIGNFHYQLAMTLSTSTRHTKRTQLLPAKSYSEKAEQILTKAHGPNHPNRVAVSSLLSAVLHELLKV
jgi:hypothetical protein